MKKDEGDEDMDVPLEAEDDPPEAEVKPEKSNGVNGRIYGSNDLYVDSNMLKVTPRKPHHHRQAGRDKPLKM